MSEALPKESDTLPPDIAVRVDEACERFEADWKAAKSPAERPSIEAYLEAAAPAERPALLRELILLDVYYRRRAGEVPGAEDYRTRFPSLDPVWLAEAVAGPPESKPIPGQPAHPTPTVSPRRIRCPHCHNPIQLNDDRSDEVLCPACGSGFRIQDTRLTSTTSEMKKLGKFHLLERVGLGSFGAVWQARDTELDRLVALKIPHEGLLSRPGDLERFHREARAAAQLRHPGIVTVHEVAVLEGVPAIVADFIDGVTLRDLLQVRPLTFREAAKVVAQVAEALDYAHGMGLVHRDIKPANIMMEFSSGHGLGASLDSADTLIADLSLAAHHASPSIRPRPLVMDFGLALRDEVETTLTVEGQILGTPAYMSPEQAAGRGHQVDRRCDVYSLGVVFYEMLCGELPFRGSRQMIVHQVLREEPKRPRTLNDKIPRDLETICLKSLEKDPRRRFGNARQLAEELRRYLAGEPIRARPVGPMERLLKWTRRRPALAAAYCLTALVLLLGGGGGGALWLWQRAETARATAEVERDLADKAKTEADEQRGLAIAARTEADDAKKGEETQRQLAEERSTYLRVANGVQLLDQGELLQSLLWFSRALAEEKRGPDYEELHRERLAAVLQQCPRLTQVFRHQGPVQYAEFSPDGRRVVTASGDTDRPGEARVWDAASGQPLTPPLKLNGQVRYATFSPDGRRVVTASGNTNRPGEARVWDAASGQPLTPPLKHNNVVWHASFSPDGRRVLTASGNSNNIGVFHIAGAGRVWDAISGQPLTPPLKHNASVKHAIFSPDGRRVLTASDDRTARVWDAASGQPLTPPLKHKNVVWHASFSPDGRRLVTASADFTARVWDAASGQPLTSPLKHNNGVTRASFSPDGRRVLTASMDETARVWDVASGQPLTPPLKHNGGVNHAAFSPDGRYVLTASWDETARVWDAANGQKLAPPLKHNSGVSHATFSADGRRVLTCSRDRTTRVWDAASGQPLTPPLKHNREVNQASFSPDGRRLVTASEYEARVWDAVSGQPLTPPLKHDGWMNLATFSPDGRRVVTASDDQTARVWDAVSGQPLTPPLKHNNSVRYASFSPDGRRVVTASWDQTARVWDVASGQPLTPPLKHNGWVYHATFSSDGRRVVTDSSSEARVWNAVSGRPLTPPLKHKTGVTRASFSPDGRRVLTAGWDETARVWDVASGQPLTPPLKHNGGVNHAAFSPDGRRVVTASDDQTARIWDLPCDNRPPQDLIILSEFQAGDHLDDQGGTVNLDPETLVKNLETLRRKYPDEFTWTLEQIRAWHREEADACAQAQLWAAVILHLDPLLEADSENGDFRLQRALAHANLAQWAQAAADFQKKLAKETDWQVVGWYPLALAGAGDKAGHRQTCAALLEGFAKTDDVNITINLAWYCLRFPDSVADPARPLQLAKQAVAAYPQNSGVLNTLGAALYRSGRFAEAVAKLEKAIQTQGKGGTAPDWLFLAMAHHGLNHADEAKKWLAKAQQWIDRTNAPRPADGSDATSLPWDQRLELKLIREEAEVLILAKKP